ncbi:MAG: iron ABC transporter permease [Pseudomonadota bacterium]
MKDAATISKIALPNGFLWRLAVIVVALLSALPILTVLWALSSGGGNTVAYLRETVAPLYAVNTLALMALVGFIAAAIGVATAWIVTAMSFPGRQILSWMLPLPLAAPAYIIAYLYTDLLEFSGPLQTALRNATGWGQGDYWFPAVRSLPGAATMLGLVLYPYVYLLARASFAAQSRSQFQAARTLGASPVRAFFQVALPGARPAIAGGLALVLMETLADFGVADYFAIPTFSTGIFRTWLAMGDRTTAMQLAGTMLLFVFVLVGAEALSRKGDVSSYDRMLSAPPPFVLSFAGTIIAITVCSIPIILGFVAPVIVLTYLAISAGAFESIASLAEYAGNSLKAAGLTSLVAVTLAMFLVYAQRELTTRRKATGSSVDQLGIQAAIRVATLGYALPGALLAVGLLAPLGALDISITQFARNTFGFDGGLLLSGTLALLIYALTVRFLTVSFNGVSGGLEKIPRAIDEAARSLGANRVRLFRDIHMPLVAPSALAAAALVFIDVMRELPATLILRPFNFETLATRVYRLASDERLTEASSAALVIIVFGVLPVALIQLRSHKDA